MLNNDYRTKRTHLDLFSILFGIIVFIWKFENEKQDTGTLIDCVVQLKIVLHLARFGNIAFLPREFW